MTDTKKKKDFSVLILGTPDGDVVLRIDYRMSPAMANRLGQLFQKAAALSIRKKPIIVPGGRPS